MLKLVNTDYFRLPGNPHMLHLATIGEGLREFIVMLDTTTQKLYIEEVVLVSVDFSKDVYANLKFISDDSLAQELAQFCQDKNILDMRKIYQEINDGRISKVKQSIR